MNSNPTNDPGPHVLGDRVKAFEDLEAQRFLPPKMPILVRLDGRAFHSFTRGCARPFDENLRALMLETARVCALETNALITYTQSDEISLVLQGHDPEGSHAYFGGRVQKITSCLAARAAVSFNLLMPNYLPAKVTRSLQSTPVFDCRVWPVPSRREACEVLEWREFDCRVNAVSMIAQAHFSHRELQGKNTWELKRMLAEKGVHYKVLYPSYFLRGTYLQKKALRRKYTAEELDSLPCKHQARFNPDLEVVRHDLVEVALPQFRSIKNPEEVVFEGADPLVDQEFEGS
jgi:tRNA(His) 5'-end guanylyltransferase